MDVTNAVRSIDRTQAREKQSVQANCFACEVVTEAEDLDAVADAFVAHGREDHAWTYPEQALRNYAMVERLRGGATFGYLAYVDGRPAGWVNASLRSDYGLYRSVDPAGPDPRSVIGVSCFVIAPPFRRHGLASTLLDRVITDASACGPSWIEGYPHNEPEESDARHFRGPRSLYDARGFQPLEVRERDTVVRRPVR